MNADSNIMTALVLYAGLFLLVLGICWIILPFAILGTKPLLRQILAEQKRTNDLLNRLEAAEQLRRTTGRLN